MKKVVFSGPSTYGLELPERENVEYCAPAARGDVLRAVKAGATHILLIDGLYGLTPSVWHKEIVFALAQGVAIFGAASLGALRAVECGDAGMIGLGGIFEEYRDGRRFDDGDVGVLHAPVELGFQPLTLALVDVEFTIEKLLAGGGLDDERGAQLLLAGREQHFSTRTWRSILAACPLGSEERAQLAKTLRSNHVSRKRLEAQSAVKYFALQTHQQETSRPAFVNTSFFAALEREVAMSDRQRAHA